MTLIDFIAAANTREMEWFGGFAPEHLRVVRTAMRHRLRGERAEWSTVIRYPGSGSETRQYVERQRRFAQELMAWSARNRVAKAA